MRPQVAIVGTQWGDEGKGKISHLLAPHFTFNTRGEGGHNAGHTIIHGGKPLVLHLIPSGITHPKCVALLGAGMVIDPLALDKEIIELETIGLDLRNRLFISPRATLITPVHLAIEGGRENLSASGVGTTGRGIGPAYEDRMSRKALRVGNILKHNFRDELAARLYLNEHTQTNIADILSSYLAATKRIARYIYDLEPLIASGLDGGGSFLLEGAQAAHLGIMQGTYPYVTASHANLAGLLAGIGFPPRRLTLALGVAKAYTTRVGNGPFASELKDETGQFLQSKGNEFGASTGRKRRCGWFDAVVVRHAAEQSGLDELCVTKLDVLTGLPAIKLITHYRHNGKEINYIPWDMTDYERCTPVYEEFPGWDKDISQITRLDDLPRQAMDYLGRIEELTGTMIGVVSVGPAAEQTIFGSSQLRMILPRQK